MKHLLFVSLLVACGPAAKPAIEKPPVAPVGPVGPVGPVAPVTYTTAEQVIEASLVKTGGRAKLATITSMHMHGTMTMAALGTPGTLESYATPPNNSLQHLEIKDLIKQDAGVKGDLAWEKNTMMGARILSGNEKSMALRGAVFNGDLDWKRLYPKAEFKGVAKFADVDCYQLELTATDGQVETRYYDKATMLPLGVEMVADTQMGKIPTKVVNGDWREAGGFLFSYKQHHEEASNALEITWDKIETNVAIPAATFEPPDDIKQLAAAAGAVK